MVKEDGLRRRSRLSAVNEAGDSELTSNKPPDKKQKPFSIQMFCRKPKFFDQSPKHRTAMGEYIVCEGGKPLTNKALDSVGPADYTQPPLHKTKHQGPEWSILNRNIYTYKGTKVPPPNTYNLPDTIITDNKFTFGKKFKPNKTMIAGACRVGPAYSVKGHETGHNAPKFSVPRAQRTPQTITGPPNPLTTPGDSAGFTTPGAQLYSVEGVLPHSSQPTITPRRPARSAQRGHPAPNEYWLSDPDPGLMKSFGIPHKEKQITRGPPPTTYNMKGTLGGPKYTMVMPPKPAIPPAAPCPTTYMREREYVHKEKITMGYATLPRTPEKNAPAPNSYKTERRNRNDQNPWTSLKSRTTVPYPASLHSAFVQKATLAWAGPASVNIRQMSPDHDKGACFTKPFTHPDTSHTPGPNDYGRLECDPLSTKPKAPAYSLRSTGKPFSGGSNPGPAAYRTTQLSPGLAASMKGRQRSSTNQNLLPAPNTYIPKKNCTNDGVSLSSRHSPWVYSALKHKVD